MNIGTVVSIPHTDKYLAAFTRTISMAQIQVNDQYKVPVSGLTIVVNEKECITNGTGWTVATELLGTYPIRTTNENVALEGDVIIENKMFDKI